MLQMLLASRLPFCFLIDRHIQSRPSFKLSFSFMWSSLGDWHAFLQENHTGIGHWKKNRKHILVLIIWWKMHSVVAHKYPKTITPSPAYYWHTPQYYGPLFPFSLLSVSSFYSSVGAWHWSPHISSGHRLIVRPTGSAGLQQSEGSTLPQTYFSVAQQPECHVRRERARQTERKRERKKPLAFGPSSAFSRFLALRNHFAPLMMFVRKPQSVQDILDSHGEHVQHALEVMNNWLLWISL